VLAQFLCTSLWFAGNAVLPDLVEQLRLRGSLLAHVTSAVQIGFITGTLLFALLTIADRFSPSLVFCVSALLAAACNLIIVTEGIGAAGVLSSRFLTGFFLAGIYPVGMKIASDYYQKGLGLSLGFLVGALVLGTSFPHLLKNFTADLPWKTVMYATSSLAFVGGIILYLFVPDGPHRSVGKGLNLSAFLSGFQRKKFRSAAFGYFGHMWELYTFWAFVPVMLTTYNSYYERTLNVPLLSFLIIASGGIACVMGGLISQTLGVKRTATLALMLSCGCCLASPFLLVVPNEVVFLFFLFFWGVVVIADSPLFSTLVARTAPEATRGTSLTIVNSIGFAITIISIQTVGMLSVKMNSQYLYLILGIGPIVGLIALLRDKETSD